jgi:hypothetical protein
MTSPTTSRATQHESIARARGEPERAPNPREARRAHEGPTHSACSAHIGASIAAMVTAGVAHMQHKTALPDRWTDDQLVGLLAQLSHVGADGVPATG